jgi:hypothetical protein
LTISADVRSTIEECNSALGRQPALARCCIFAEDLKAISKLAGANAVAVGKLVRCSGSSGGVVCKWSVSEFRCFPILTVAAASVAAAAAAD